MHKISFVYPLKKERGGKKKKKKAYFGYKME